ncbi:MAG: transposase, partial [Nostoc sp.]|uniref:IS4/Tn5 family transposase DNA-binding protein n=1 Tax=Nostoc sp. TaxID=1180 RepID=UPI002FF553F0
PEVVYCLYQEVETYLSQQMEQWIAQELERTELGDARRTKRLIKIVENLSAKPSSSIPQASGTWAQTKATYDFWDSPYIQPSMIRLLTY